MLTRRHIRIKVVQSIYAFDQTENRDLDKQEKFLHYSIDQMHDLYVLLLQVLVEMQKHQEAYTKKSQQKHLATDSEKNPSRNFIDNKLIDLIAHHQGLQETVHNKKLDYWSLDDEYIAILLKDLRQRDFYTNYLKIKDPSFADDKQFAVCVYKEVIAPNDKLYEYLEDKRLTWVDDFAIVNTALVKVLNKLKESNAESSLIPDLYKNDDDRDFATTLFRKVALNDEKLAQMIEGKTPNWDQDRIADVDMIIIKMGIAEFLYFPSIPTRATINEYLEIAKEYSTPKSSIFINGILDKLVKELAASEELNKIGRGLL
jgi:N utilization substance protein B